MKIAILTQSTYPFEVGGAQLHTYYLAKAIQKDQHVVTVITTGNKDSYKTIENINFRIVRIPKLPFLSSVLIFFRYCVELLWSRPDFILVDLVTTGLSELPVFFINMF